MDGTQAIITYEQTIFAAYKGIVHNQLAFVSAAAVLYWEGSFLAYTSPSTHLLIIRTGLLTFQQLRRDVFPLRWTITKLAILDNWFWVRFVHVPICAAMTFAVFPASVCEHAYLVHPYICLFALFGSQVILVLRVITVWGSNRVVGIGIVVFFLVTQGFAYWLPSMLRYSPVIADLPMCGFTTAPGAYDSVWCIFLPSFILEITCLGLVIGRCWYERRHGTSLVHRFAREDILYMSAVAGINLVNILVIRFVPNAANSLILWTPCVAITSIACHRLMIDTKADDLLSFTRFGVRLDAFPSAEGVTIDMNRHIAQDQDDDLKEELGKGRRPAYIMASLPGSYIDMTKDEKVSP